MLSVIFGIFGVIILLFFIQVAIALNRGKKKGALVASSLFEFERIYSEEIEQGKSAKDSFRKAFITLRNCPDLGELNEEQFQKVGNIIMEIPKPDLFIHKIIMGNSAKKTMLMLKDIEFLSKLVEAFKRDTRNKTDKLKSIAMKMTISLRSTSENWFFTNMNEMIRHYPELQDLKKDLSEYPDLENILNALALTSTIGYCSKKEYIADNDFSEFNDFVVAELSPTNQKEMKKIWDRCLDCNGNIDLLGELIIEEMIIKIPELNYSKESFRNNIYPLIIMYQLNASQTFNDEISVTELKGLLSL